MRPAGRGERPIIPGAHVVANRREETMETHGVTSGRLEHAPHHPSEHGHGIGPVDTSYKLVVRTVLWVIAGLVFLGFAIWWIMN